MGRLALLYLLLGLSLTAGWPALALPEGAASPLSFSVTARFQRERRGDGSPTIRYRYRLENKTDETIYLDTYYRPFRIARLEPRSAFRVQRVQPPPHTMRLPRASDIVELAPRATKVITDWQWTSSFELRSSQPGYLDVYFLKRPSRVRLQLCFTSSGHAELERLLPAGRKLWRGTLCAEPVAVRIAALPTAP